MSATEGLALPAADPSSYEDAAIAWASELSDLLVGRQSDGWAARCSSLTGLYEAQQTESWCGYASLRLALRALAPSATIPTQSELASKYQFRGGISLAELRATAEAEARRIDPSIRTTQVDGHLDHVGARDHPSDEHRRSRAEQAALDAAAECPAG